MVRVIVTKCGRSIRRSIIPMDSLSQWNHRNALVGCGTDDDEGNYVEIAEVRFVARVSTDPLPE